jgi:hypothetical protein
VANIKFRRQRMRAFAPQQPFKILYSGRSELLDIAPRCLQFQITGHSYSMPQGRQRYADAKRQELGTPLVAFITIGECDDRTRAVVGDEAQKVRTGCRRR